MMEEARTCISAAPLQYPFVDVPCLLAQVVVRRQSPIVPLGSVQDGGMVQHYDDNKC